MKGGPLPSLARLQDTHIAIELTSFFTKTTSAKQKYPSQSADMHTDYARKNDTSISGKL